MTRYTVTWTKTAQDELVRLWLSRSDLRDRISSAANAIDRQLARDPQLRGNAIDKELRNLICRPLIVMFSVSPQDRIVKVTNVGVHDSVDNKD